MIKVVLGAIIIVFSFWGAGSYRDRKLNQVAVVNGTIITRSEYRSAFDNLLEGLRQQLGGNFNEDMVKSFGLRQQALNGLIDQRLLLDEADRQGLRVTDNELSKAIMESGAFQSSGRFNERMYGLRLRQIGMSPEQFEALQRNAFLISKLQSYVGDNAKVSAQEMEDYYNWQNASVDIDFVLFPPDQYTGIYPTAEEIESFYEDHKGLYRTDAMVRIRYLNFESETYSDDVAINDDEVSEYYYSNLREFQTPKTLEARHILLKVDSDADPANVEEKKQRALDVLKEAREGRDFAELAKQHSEGPTAGQGGRLAAFKREDMAKPFSDKAFSMEENEISEPVRTRFGWHIIKVEKVNEGSTRPLEEAESGIRQKLKGEQGRDLAYEEVQAVYDTSFEGDDLVEAAAARGMPVLTSSLFSMRDPDRALKSRAKVAKAAFDLPVDEISEVIDHGDGYYIMQVLERRPERISDLSEVSDRVRSDLIKQTQDDKARKAADDFLAELEMDGSIMEEGAGAHLKPDTTGLFRRTDTIPKIGNERDILSAAFSLSERRPLHDIPIKGNSGYYVIRFKQRKAPDMVGYEKESAGIKERLLQQKKASVMSTLLTQLKDASTIEVEEDYLQ